MWGKEGRMVEITHIDCFSGPGGICTGFHAAGIHTLIAIEHVKSCVDTYSANHPEYMFFTLISEK